MRSDRGVGLIELLVVMSLMTLALTMFGLAFSAMLRTSDASREIGSVTDQARLALNELDRQVRFGYWVKPKTVVCSLTCPAIQVLTTNTDGSLECWVWAIDKEPGTLVTYHYPPPVGAFTLPGLPSAGGAGWHVAAGPEGGPTSDAVAIGPSTSTGGLGIVSGSKVTPIDPTTFARQTYWVSAYAALTVTGPDRPPVDLAFTMSVRNQWIGAPNAAKCP